MAESLFHRKAEAKPASTRTPHELIQKEVAHLRKRATARHGDKPRRKFAIAATLTVVCLLLGLFFMDPILHAWYRYDAIHAYTYLHYFGGGKEANELATSGILRPDEVHQLNLSPETYKDDFATPRAAAQNARAIIDYMASVRALHSGRYEDLHWLGRLRYDIFVRIGLMPPASWDFLDPDIPSDAAPAPMQPAQP